MTFTIQLKPAISPCTEKSLTDYIRTFLPGRCVLTREEEGPVLKCADREAQAALRLLLSTLEEAGP